MSVTMRIGNFKKALLVLALVLGQWLAVAHAFQHPALGSGEQLCQICLHAQGLDSAATAPEPAAPLQLAAEEIPATALPLLPARVRPRSYPIRGPPVSFA